MVLILFLLILFFALAIVIGIFGLVIAVIFDRYPSSVLSVWMAMPLAVVIGWLVYRRGVGLLGLSITALAILYACVWAGAYWWLWFAHRTVDRPSVGLLFHCLGVAGLDAVAAARLYQ